MNTLCKHKTEALHRYEGVNLNLDFLPIRFFFISQLFDFKTNSLRKIKFIKNSDIVYKNI